MKVIAPQDFRETFRLRAEHLGIEAVADRAAAEHTAIALQNIFELCPFSGTDTVVDIGSGDGQFADQVSSRVNRVIAVDLTPIALSGIRARLSARTNVRYACAVSESLPLRDGSVSRVVVNSVFYALGSCEEAEKTIADIHRTLCVGGLAYFGEIPTVDERGNSSDSRHLLVRVLNRIRRHGIGSVLQRMWDSRRTDVVIMAPNSFLYWPRETFVGLLEQYGFRVQRIEPHRTVHGLTTRLNYLAEKV